MWLGIDFGTTNSAISFSDGKRIHTFQVDAKLPNLLPSLIYVSKNFENYVGTAARDVYLEKNTDRPSLFKPITVGTIRLDVGDAGGYAEIEQNVIVMIDVLSPGRLIRSIKTGLRTMEYNGSTIFGRYYRVEELIAILLKQLVAVVEPLIGEPITQIVMGRPVKFSDSKAVDQAAEDRIVKAANLVGIEEVTFLPEPIAAAYAYHRDFDRPTNSFIFDFGGGTLDLTVARLGGDEPEILATEGVLIGGDDFDKRLFESLLPHFGKGALLTMERMDGSVSERPLPEHIWGSLLDWQTVEEMKQTDTLDMIEEAAQTGNSTDPRGMRALHELVHRNLYYKLLRRVEEAKVDLSRHAETRLVFSEQSIEIDELITREQFDQMINMEVATIAKSIERVLANSGLTANDIEQVVPTGGSSQIPIFQRMLRGKFPHATFANKAEREMTGVVQGLGIYGYDLEEKAKDVMPLIRTRIFDHATSAPVQLPLQGGKREQTGAYSHAVAGIDTQGDVAFVPYQTSKRLGGDPLVRLRNAVFSSTVGKVILGTTLSKFVVCELVDLRAMTQDVSQTPHQLKLNRERAEEFIFVDKWNRAETKPLTILVTRYGNVRAFQTRLVDKPLRDEGMWQLDMRNWKPDPPAALVGVMRASQILLVTEDGKVTKLRVKEISVRGSKGLKLTKATGIHAITLDHGTQVVVVFADGSAERLHTTDIPFAPKSGSAGRQKFRRDVPIIGLLPVAEADHARAISDKGQLVELFLGDVKRYGGQHQLGDVDRGAQLVRCWI